MRRLILILCAAAVAVAILAPSAVAAERKVPFGFLGAMADGPLVEPPGRRRSMRRRP